MFQESRKAVDLQNSKNKLLFQQKNIEEKEKTLEKKRLTLKDQVSLFLIVYSYCSNVLVLVNFTKSCLKF